MYKRQLLLRPSIIFADEPTGNLDQSNGRVVLDCLANYAEDGATVIMATHDSAALSSGNKHVQFNEGKGITVKSE